MPRKPEQTQSRIALKGVKSGIYCLVFETGHYYYGQSSNLISRYWKHVELLRNGRVGNPRIRAVYNKCKKLPAIELICACDVDDLDEAEQMFLDEFVGNPGCLNISKCAEAVSRGLVRGPMTAEHREKLSLAKRGKAPPNKGKPSPFKGIPRGPYSEEIRAKMSAAKKGKPSTYKGKKSSPETRAKISEALRARPVKEETKLKRSIAMKEVWRKKKLLAADGEVAE